MNICQIKYCSGDLVELKKIIFTIISRIYFFWPKKKEENGAQNMQEKNNMCGTVVNKFLTFIHI